ncbi:MAG: type VI secretion system tip protein TssI/VgrG [Acidobacteriota bacterium]
MSYSQSGRRLKVTTPLGPDVLILNGFSGHEAISRPFQFQLECVAENDKAKQVVFDALLGQKITAEIAMPGGSPRYLNGTCLRVAEGARDATFTRFVLDLVPQALLLARKTQSRIFQQISVPDILKKVLVGLDVSWEIQGVFPTRDYCVQYRESDFAFASRLMEEEGIYYFFKHGAGSHTMVVANTPGSHASLPGPSSLIFEAVGGGTRTEDRVNAWEKAQELKSSKVVLWDHCFELPHKHLDAENEILAAVAAGKTSHKLKLAANSPLELYDFPGAYAQRFDGIQPGGGDRPADIQKVFDDNKRTARLRMEEQAAASILVHAASNCRQIVSGHKFTLERHFAGDGSWVVYQVEHSASDAADLRAGGGGFTYENHFTCFPAALPFRPPRVTPIPTVKGTQTAVVVGPPGEEIFTDKYSRIKVQFHWDREGKSNSDSSCWVRVATPWAGKQWGAIHIPRIGQEVVVDFLEGDMDQPIVIGSVYNAECMPPYSLPANKTQSGLKSRSSLGGNPSHFNEFRFEDKKGHEQVFLHAEKNQDIEVENSETHWVGHDRSKTIDHDETTHVKHDRTETVDNNETISIGSNRTETVGQNETITIALNRTETVGVAETLSVGANRSVTIGANGTWAVGAALSLSVGGALNTSVGTGQATSVGKSSETTVGKKYSLVAGDEIQFQTGDASITLKKDGTIQIKGKDITISGTGKINVKASSDITMKGSKISQN